MTNDPPELHDEPIINTIRGRYDEIKESMIAQCGPLHYSYQTDTEVHEESEEKQTQIDQDEQQQLPIHSPSNNHNIINDQYSFESPNPNHNVPINPSKPTPSL